MSAHENLERMDEDQGSSNRTFGLVFTAFLAIVGSLPLLRGAPPRRWALTLAALFLAAALLAPALLTPLNRVWTKLGLLLHLIVSPVVAALLYYGVISPVGVLMRTTGKDPLRLRFDRQAQSYWIERVPPGPPPATMSRQF